jgi:hypothetical protein
MMWQAISGRPHLGGHDAARNGGRGAEPAAATVEHRVGPHPLGCHAGAAVFIRGLVRELGDAARSDV